MCVCVNICIHIYIYVAVKVEGLKQLRGLYKNYRLYKEAFMPVVEGCNTDCGCLNSHGLLSFCRLKTSKD